MVRAHYTSAPRADLPNLANLDYIDRINRAIDYVTRHLAEPLPLEDVAKAAAFSPFHFHRIFRSLMQETLASFVKRVRLERAVYLMSYRKGASLTEIAYACGFSSSSDFSRSFRGQYGIPPSVFDGEAFRLPQREAMQQSAAPAEERHRLTLLPKGENPDGFEVRFRDLPARQVAYIRVTKAYGRGPIGAVERLTAWAEDRGIAHGQWLGYQWDDPEIVPQEKCRYDVGVEVPPGTTGDRDVTLTEFAPTRVAELDIVGPIDLELRALHWLYLTWLPNSGCAPAHEPVFEAWNGRPFAHGMKHFELRLQLPVIDGSAPL